MSTDAPNAMPGRRLLLVHAHPDDESINNGASMAKYVADGAHVTLVTCTRGEEGEVLVESLSKLASVHDDKLGEHRVQELATAMKVLGVTDHRFLGGEGRYRDTGMEWHPEETNTTAMVPSEVRDDTFWAADLREAADHLVEVIREIRPQVLVTYDEHGGYGHPDHVQAHRVATYGAALAAVPSYRTDLGEAWDIQKIYWVAIPEEGFRDAVRQLRDEGNTAAFEGMDPDGPLPYMFVPDAAITTVVDGSEYVDKKIEAMKAHATQIAVEGDLFALSNNIGNQIWATESYRLVKGTPGPPNAETGKEGDLFAGVA
jgi:N-acetyl-1-D-myo-inositol-2-amino-2-deoxy-alpha-D-glucopyranoside deacetylase